MFLFYLLPLPVLFSLTRTLVLALILALTLTLCLTLARNVESSSAVSSYTALTSMHATCYATGAPKVLGLLPQDTLYSS